MKILTVPHPILTQKAKPVKKIDDKIHHLVKEMIKVLNKQINPPGVGLAAPQVGKNLALFIMKPTEKVKPRVFINPKILKLEIGNWKLEINSKSKSQKKQKRAQLEGCLSLPKIWGTVKRANRVLVEYQDLSGEKKTEWFSDFEATIIQHEIDHLNGILFTKRVLDQKQKLYQETEGKLKAIEI